MKAFQKTAIMLLSIVMATILGVILSTTPDILTGPQRGAGACFVVAGLITVSFVVGFIDTKPDK